MRLPTRAVAAVAILFLTGCGSLADPAASGYGIATAVGVATYGSPRPGALAGSEPPWALDSVSGATDLVIVDLTAEVLAEQAAAAEQARLDAEAAAEAVRRRTADLPQPSWWNGVCDSGNYRGARPLGASYRGVQACGPQPGRSQGRLVRFYPGAWGHYEWQCTELVFRFMYLAYGVTPYNAPTGGQVVDNWRPEYGGNFEKVRNGSGALPSPGDIVSTTATHTAIVTGVEVDEQGDGFITVLEQNAPNDGSATWKVNGRRIDKVKNWLHVLD